MQDSISLRLSRGGSPEQAALLAIAALETAAREAVNARGVFSLALSGGQTPLALFHLLSRPEHACRLPWGQTIVAWVDERCVPHRHEASNYGAALAALAPLACAKQVLPIDGTLPPEEAARRYENTLAAALSPAPHTPPVFDCILLGMGGDGHTASLFPGSSGLRETQRAVCAQYPETAPHPRITLTLPVLNAARSCLFLVTGEGKHGPLQQALSLLAPPVLPVQHVRPANGVLHWIIDTAAACGNLPPTGRRT